MNQKGVKGRSGVSVFTVYNKVVSGSTVGCMTCVSESHSETMTFSSNFGL